MYESYFGLTERPFSIAPDPQYLYMSKRHKEAMAHLSYGLSQGGCFIVLTGEVGTGKTTLCRNLMTDLPDNVDLALILNANINETELLQTICDELKISYTNDSSQKQLLDLINQHLLSTFANNRHTVLIIDEAQLLSRDVLEQVRLLTNLETTKHKLLQIILIGQPELSDMLTRNDLRQLAQRVTARYHLGELKRSEIEEYVNYRLGVAGCKQPLFSNKALSKLHQLTDGIPRKINVLADHALLSAYAQKQKVVDSVNIKDSAKEVFFASKQKPVSDRSTTKWWFLGLGVLLLNAALWWYFVANNATTKNKIENDVSSVQSDSSELKSPTVERIEDEPSNQSNVTVSSEQAVAGLDSIESVPPDVDANEAIAIAEELPEPIEQPEPIEPVELLEPIKQVDQVELTEPISKPSGSTVSVVVSEEYLDADLDQPAQASFVEPTIAQTVIEQTEFGRILETSADLTGRITVFRALTKLWGVQLPNQIFNSMCAEVQVSGLQCIFFTDWQQMLRYNRPAVLVLRHDNQLHRVILEVIDNDAAEVRIGETVYRIGVDELRARWQGNDAVLVWRPSEAGSSFLQPGDRGVSLPIVRQYLNKALSKLELPNIDETNSIVFDQALTNAAFDLQRSFEVVTDGKIGNETYLLMNEIMRPNSTPVLSRRVP